MAEDSDRNVSLAIGGIAIIEGAVPNFEKFKDVLAERIQTIPRCTQMLRTQPFDIGAPQWVDDPGFDPGIAGSQRRGRQDASAVSVSAGGGLQGRRQHQ